MNVTHGGASAVQLGGDAIGSYIKRACDCVCVCMCVRICAHAHAPAAGKSNHVYLFFSGFENYSFPHEASKKNRF